ncbi:hypothetical protein Poli38472_010774 [Pythium oligandrum]|uniref:Reverse transcriptase domain-containing protein n=1 Tax=Pythium oligandrum TaxID=41045 RepID=A0A8K1FGJ2_PYTOL|nr:hypothetical protein Poli38472_010774 [Pythium oligandrum]|eukprot:TMW61711.1 hypothetical protein Poli38472_010774 [Pythium oligandrum]
MAAVEPRTVNAYAATKPGLQVEPFQYQARPLGLEDVEIAISHCGICGSDLHTISGGWGGANYPVVPGHEIVGTITSIGSDVKHLKVGDRVGVGAMVFSCLNKDTCKECASDHESYCTKCVFTYNRTSPDLDHVQRQGGSEDMSRDPEPRLELTRTSVTATFRSEAITIVGIYAPVSRKKREELFTKMAEWERPAGKLFMGGDFNCTLDMELDRTRGGRRAFDSPALHRLLETWDLVDADTADMLEAHASSQIASYRASKHTFMNTQKADEVTTCRLDRWYVDRMHYDQVDDVVVHTPVSRSDHDAVLLRYGTTQSEGRRHTRRARRRKLLKYPIPPCARTTVKEISEQCLRQLEEVVDELDAEKLAEEWDKWKTRLRSQCLRAKRDCMILQRHQRGLRRRRIEKELRNVRRRANEPAAEIPATVEGITHAIEQMTLDRAARATHLREQLTQLNAQRGKQGRNRRFGAYRGNSAAATSAFFKRISTKFQRRRQVAVPRDPSSSLSAPEQMAADWKHITQQTPVDKRVLDEFFKKLGSVAPRPGMGKLLGAFLPSEVSAAIRSCPRGKSSGPDGLPNDWYREHEEMLAPILAEVYSKWFERGIVPDSFQQAIICCLPKTTNPKSGLDFRPIALLNTDYKIYSRLLLNRVRPLLANLVSPLQFGFVPGRQVHDAIDVWTAVQRLVTQGKGPRDSVALLLDFAKAYDTLDREFLYAVLTRFGFPDQFVTTVRQMHRSTTAAYLVDGELSTDHPVTNGIRQGCPLAPVLFILAVDTLHEIFSRSTDLSGIEINAGQRIKSAGFADDTTVYIQGPHEEKPVLGILQEFGDASGLRINMGKCIAVCLDSAGPRGHHNDMQIRPIKAGQHVRYLGMQVASRVDKDYVWTLTLQQIRSRLHLAEMKTTNIRQRAKIVKAVVLPKVLFVARHQCPTAGIITQIQRFISNYVWQGSPTADARTGKPWMSRQTAALPGAAGGLGLPLVHEECLLTSAKMVLRWARPISGIRGAIGTALLNGTPAGGSATNVVSITRDLATAPRLNSKNFATTGVSTLRSITAQPRGDEENRIQATLCAKPVTTRTDRRWWNDGWYHADFSEDQALLFALLNEQNAGHGSFNKGGLMIARALGDGVLATVDKKSGSSRQIEKSDFPNLLQAHDRIQDVLDVTWHRNYTLRFKARRHDYPMSPVLVREFRRFCEILVYNYPALLYAREEPKDLCLHPPSHDTWRLEEADDGFILEVVTLNGKSTQLGQVTTRIEAQKLARMHLDDRRATFELHPLLDAFVPIWNQPSMERRPTLKQKIYRSTTERAEREAASRTKRLRAEDDTVGNALAELEWTTIMRLRHATEGQKLLMQRIKGGRISGWDRLHRKRGCPHCEEDADGGRVSHIFWYCPKAQALWSQLEEAWTPSGKGWERSYPRQFCHEVFSLSMSANPTGLWDWEKLHPSTVDAPEVTIARTKIVDLWKQHVLVTLNVLWRWRNDFNERETYNSTYVDGQSAYGGYAEYVRVSGHYAFKIPEEIPSDVAAPLLCAGVTVYTPLKAHIQAGQRVGVVGIGGLGHLGLQFIRALGAEPVAFSQSPNKEQAARELGAVDFINLSKPDDLARAQRSVDVLLVTADAKGQAYDAYLSTIVIGGKLLMVGVPDDKMAFSAFSLCAGGISVVGSLIGGIKDTVDMLALAAEKNVRPVIQKLPMSKANEGIKMVDEGRVRYRVVLEN